MWRLPVRPFLQCPLTIDYDAFHLFLTTLSPDFSAGGAETDISAALRAAMDGFDPEGNSEKAIILITDGENTGDDPFDEVEKASKQNIKIFTIGVGQEGGVPIPGGEEGFKKDASGQIVMTRLDEDLLKRMAAATKGAYVRSVAGDMDLEAIYSDEIRGKMELTAVSGGKKKSVGGPVPMVPHRRRYRFNHRNIYSFCKKKVGIFCRCNNLFIDEPAYNFCCEYLRYGQGGI